MNTPCGHAAEPKVVIDVNALDRCKERSSYRPMSVWVRYQQPMWGGGRQEHLQEPMQGGQLHEAGPCHG